MRRTKQKITIVIAALSAVSCIIRLPTTYATNESKDVFPASTKFSLAVGNQTEFNDRYAKTGLGKCLDDPLLKPFLDDLPRQVREEANTHPLGVLWIDLGIDREDVKGLTNGEVAWALVHPKGSRPSRVFMANVSERKQQVDALLQKVAAAMKDQKATKTESDVGGATVTIFDIPAEGNLDKRKLVHVVKNDRLVITESVEVVKTMLQNLSGDGTNTLASQEGYTQVVKDCQQRAGDEKPDAIMFLVPIDLSEALRELSPSQEERSVDTLAVARKQSFDTISALGGFITVGQDAFDFRVRISIHAPRPWKNAMRMCKFPNQKLVAANWVGGENNAYTVMNIDFAELSKYVGPLFDDLVGYGEEGLYEDLKNTMREDPDGPEVDIDKEFFGKLSPQIVLLTQHRMPVTAASSQRLIALSTTDVPGMVSVVKKVLEADPGTQVKKVVGKDAYFTYIEEESDDFSSETNSEPQDDSQSPGFITCIANGHLMFATDEQILASALQDAGGNSMSQNADYKKLLPYLQQFGDKTNLQAFLRVGDAIHVNYELARQGKMPEGGKSFMGLLSNIAAGEPPEDAGSKFDGSKLPTFDKLKKYFGLAGVSGTETSSGWYLEGFVLKSSD